MHIDLNALDPHPHDPITSRICILGGGVAGLLLAEQLASRGTEVHLLEAGGLELEDRSQSLFAAEMGGSQHTGTTHGRFRTFGGSSVRWGGQLLPFSTDIFCPPPGVPSLAWPICGVDLQPFYPEIERVMGVDTLPFSDHLLTALGRPAVPLPEDLCVRFSKWAPFSKRNLAHTVGRRLLEHPHAHIYTHANAAELLPGGDGHLRGVRVRDYRGRSVDFAAEVLIVAAGTIESSRLLLASPSAVPNPHDQLGRYFHDHVSLHAGQLQGRARAQYLDLLGPLFNAGTLHTVKLEASPELRAREDLPACMAHIVIEEPEGSGAAALRNLLRSLQQGRIADAIGSNLVPMLRGSAEIARLLYATRVQHRRSVSSQAKVYLNIDLEQPPDSANRIRLSGTTDALGLQRAVVDWRTGPEEQRTAHRFANLLCASLRTAGLPEPEWTPGLLEGEAIPFADTYHPMGGLRMGSDPAQSVVDADLRVHGVDNLYVASCATFPSGGSSNPTFTLMALALRLADHLSASLH